MNLATILAAAAERDGRLVATVPENWMQGRTGYGGLTVALALEAARRSEPLPPLRSVQVAFIGPTTGELECRPELLRRGRSAVFMRVEVHGGAGLALSVIFLFAAPRPAPFDYMQLPMPTALDPAEAEPTVFAAPEILFAGNLDYRHPRPAGERRAPDLLQWVRLRERDSVPAPVELVTVADALPPGAMAVTPKRGPISSMTWTFDLLMPEPATDDGWWLLRSVPHQVRDGLSSQSMTIWNRAGTPVASGMQSIAIFG